MKEQEVDKVQFIHIPTEVEVNHLEKKRFFELIRDHLLDILTNPNVQTITFTSSIDGVMSIVPRQTIERLIYFTQSSLEKDDTSLGFNDEDWRKDFKNLLSGSIEDAPVFTEVWRCREGHAMTIKKGNGYTYYRCPLDGEFKWGEEVS